MVNDLRKLRSNFYLLTFFGALRDRKKNVLISLKRPAERVVENDLITCVYDLGQVVRLVAAWGETSPSLSFLVHFDTVQNNMNYDLFNIEERLRQIYSNSLVEFPEMFKGEGKRVDIGILEWSKNIEKEIQFILSKKKQCIEIIDLTIEKKNAKKMTGLEHAACAIQYAKEVIKLLEKFTDVIIGAGEDVDMGGITWFRGRERYKSKMFTELKKILDYFIEINEEVYHLIKTNSYEGAMARHRVQIEIFSLFLFFTKYPECLERFADHRIIKKYQIEKTHSNHISDELQNQFEKLKTKYTKEDFKNRNLNYWWAASQINNLKSIKEIMDKAFDDEQLKTEYKKLYNFYSEFPHISTYVIDLEKINEKYIFELLRQSVDMNFYIMHLYIGWLLDNSYYVSSPIEYLKSIYMDLREVVCGVPQPTWEEMMKRWIF